MPVSLGDLVDPRQAAVVTCGYQRGIVGDLSYSPFLTSVLADGAVIGSGLRLLNGARGAGVRVVHTVMEMRADRAGFSINNPMLALSAKNPDLLLEGSAAVEIIPEAGPHPADIVCKRIHGVTAFTGTELDSILRNLGIRTIIPAGVAITEAILGLCLTAADLGYRIVLPSDAVAGYPPDYAESVVKYTCAMLSNIVTVDEILLTWTSQSALFDQQGKRIE